MVTHLLLYVVFIVIAVSALERFDRRYARRHHPRHTQGEQRPPAAQRKAA